VLGEVFSLSSDIAIEALSEWFNGLPEFALLDENQNNHFFWWMLDSLEKEEMSSKLIIQSKLSHLIPSIRNELNNRTRSDLIRTLDALLQQMPSAQ